MRVWLAHAVDDHGDHQVVGDQGAVIHVVLGFAAELGVLGAVGAQQIAAGNVWDAVFGGDASCLSSFASPDRSQQNQVEVATGQ